MHTLTVLQYIEFVYLRFVYSNLTVLADITNRKGLFLYLDCFYSMQWKGNHRSPTSECAASLDFDKLIFCHV